MKVHMKLKQSRLFAIALSSFLLNACVFSEKSPESVSGKGASSSVSFLPITQSVSLFGSTPVQQCYRDEYLPKLQQVHKLDLLFVLDTSGSMSTERSKISQAINHFVQSLEKNSDVNMGVLLAHGKKSKYYGKLYSKTKEPQVLQVLDKGLGYVQGQLHHKFASTPSDSTTDGGEVGLAAVMGLLESENYSLAQSQGFFRKDAALGIVFVADENDLCAVYPEGLKPVFDPERVESVASARECVWNGQSLTEKTVYDELSRVYSDRPFWVSGFIYNDLKTIPKRGENELGYGYLEFIERAKGRSIDLATCNFAHSLSELGSWAQEVWEYPSRFSLTASAPIDPDSIQVTVDGIRVKHEYDSDLLLAEIAQEDAVGLRTLVEYCEKIEVTPSPEPTQAPSPEPTQAPSPEPTQAPSPEPTQAPSPEPTQAPTPEPTQAPSPEPTQAPTPEPTQAPTPEPTQAPTPEPTPGGEWNPCVDGRDCVVIGN